MYLSPEDLFKEETEEALEHVQIAVNVLRTFKQSFQSHRNNLGSFYRDSNEFKPWDFRSQLVFARYDRFLERLMKIEVFNSFNCMLLRYEHYKYLYLYAMNCK